MIENLWTIGGPHDLVVAMETRDGETAAALDLAIVSPGNLRTVSTRAYTSEEMAELIKRAG